MEFWKGDRVRATEDAIQNHIVKGPVEGTVVTRSRSTDKVTVLVDGQKTAKTTHPAYWERIGSGEVTARVTMLESDLLEAQAAWRQAFSAVGTERETEALAEFASQHGGIIGSLEW